MFGLYSSESLSKLGLESQSNDRVADEFKLLQKKQIAGFKLNLVHRTIHTSQEVSRRTKNF
jgi:hypothetical protein